MCRKLFSLIFILQLSLISCKESKSSSEASSFVKATQLLPNKDSQCNQLKKQMAKISRPALSTKDNYDKAMALYEKAATPIPEVNLLIDQFNQLQPTDAELDAHYFLTTKAICNPNFRLKFGRALIKGLDSAQISKEYKEKVITQVMKPMLFPEPQNTTMVDTIINLTLLRRLQQLEMVKVSDPLFETKLKSIMKETRGAARGSIGIHKAYANRNYQDYYRLVTEELRQVQGFQVKVKTLASEFSF